jgi:peroxiredoxin
MSEMDNPTGAPDESSAATSANLADANPATAAPPAKPSLTRWIVAGAAGVAIALFAMPLLLGGRGDAPPADTPAAESTVAPSASGGGVCAAKRAPAKLDFTVKDMHGADVRLVDYKGRVILLNYWATWCGPCKVEIPDLVALQNQYKDQGLVVLGVSQDDDPETLRTFASEYKMNYPILVGRDKPELLDAQGPLWGLPTSYVIGRDGAICTRHLGAASKATFEREIKALL